MAKQTHIELPPLVPESVEAIVPETKKKVDHYAQYLKDQTPVRGIFRFHEVPGGKMAFTYKKWKWENLKDYNLVDGEIVTLPLGVAVHLNTNPWYGIHTYATDKDGKPIAKIGQKVQRCSFQSLEFMDVEGLTPVGQPLVTIENMY